MPKPINRRELIRKLKGLGFQGPFLETKHQYMIKGVNHKIFIPNPHGKDIGAPLVSKIINQIGVDPKNWEGMREYRRPFVVLYYYAILSSEHRA